MSTTIKLDKIRNIGIVAHIDAGKTTLTERILFYAGRIHKMGEVHDGQAVMDWMPEEQEKGITITAAVTQFMWQGHEIHLIDTPGHVDFTIEVERSLRVLDGAIFLFSGVEGVEPQSETIWHQADKYQIPRLAFINKMDRIGADFFAVVEMMKKKLGARPALCQIPLGMEEKHRGVIDLVRMCGVVWDEDDLGVTYRDVPIPPDMVDEAALRREELVECVAEFDDTLMETYLQGGAVASADIERAVRSGTLKLRITPVFCGAAYRNRGVQTLLDGVIKYLPSPADIPPIKGFHPTSKEIIVREPKKDAPLTAFAFKIMMDEGRKLCYLRIYSGTLHAESVVFNASQGQKERIARMFHMHANSRKRITTARAGDIVAVVGLKHIRTGDTLCDEAHPIVLESIEFYEPVISVAIEPRSIADQERLLDSLEKLAAEDPTFRYRFDEESGQTLISGMGELHLEVLVQRLTREFNVKAAIGKPQVVYRETITRPVEEEGEFAKEIGGKMQYGNVRIAIEPLERGKGIVFLSALDPGRLEDEYIQMVEEGVRSCCLSGGLRGYPVVDVKCTLIDAEYREGQSTPLAFRIAAASAFQRAYEKANPILLEPIMAVDVIVPEEYSSGVIGDINARRGRIIEILPRKQIIEIRASIPLSNMFGYSTELRSLSKGRGTFTMQFQRFDELS